MSLNRPKLSQAAKMQMSPHNDRPTASQTQLIAIKFGNSEFIQIVQKGFRVGNLLLKRWNMIKLPVHEGLQAEDLN